MNLTIPSATAIIIINRLLFLFFPIVDASLPWRCRNGDNLESNRIQNFQEQMCYELQYESLVLEGGGLKGLAYIGATKALNEYGYFSNNVWQFKNLTGTSIGCLFGYFLALDISPENIEKIALNADFRKIFYKDVQKLFQIPMPPSANSYFTEKITYFYELMQYVRRLLYLWFTHNSPGLSNGSEIKKWIFLNTIKYSPYRNVITENTTVQEFEEITQHHLTCFATKVTSQDEIQLLTLNSNTVPNQKIWNVLYASMTLPIIFKPLSGVDEKTAILDGGLILNFPIYSQDWNGLKNKRVLGLSLHNKPDNTANDNYYTFGLLKERPNNKQQKTSHKQPSQRHSKPQQQQYERYSQIKMIKYLQSLLHAGSTSAYIRYSMDPQNFDRVIYLNASNLPTIDFDLDKQLILKHSDIAYEQTMDFFSSKGV